MAPPSRLENPYEEQQNLVLSRVIGNVVGRNAAQYEVQADRVVGVTLNRIVGALERSNPGTYAVAWSEDTISTPYQRDQWFV